MITDVVSPILQWLNAHPHLSGFGVFLISAAESVAIIGTIVPGSVMMTAIGALAGAGVIPLWPTIIWAILGAVVGDGISYWLGHYFKDRLHYIWPFKQRPQLLRTGEIFFERFGGMSVFIGRFVGPVRALVPLVAGMLGMKPTRFYLANIASAIGWAPAYMLPGIILGAASLELPPDIAVHAMLMMLLVTLFVILCAWTLYKLFVLISNQVNQFLNGIWMRLGDSKYFRSITTLLKHYNVNKTHGQLTIAFYLVIVTFLFLYLASYVATHGSKNIFVNDSLFYLFRSWRTPIADQIMLMISNLGEKNILFPTLGVVSVWLAYKKRWHTAKHILALGILTAGLVEFFKHFIHSARPWGIQLSPSGGSFPSGHSVLAITCYIGFGLLLVKAFKWQRSKILFGLISIIILAVSVSRLYLGAHWFTDVLGGWLLGAAILMLIVLSYNRKAELPLEPKGILITFFATFFITYSAFYFHTAEQFKKNNALLDWPTYTVSLNDWWQQSGKHLPRYRINRFGLSTEVLNLQWIANLDNIKAELMKNGWEIPPEQDWIGVLHRISDVESSEHLPLVSPLYLDKKPALVLIKHANGNKKLVVLRLWDSHVFIQNSSLPLWVGTVNVAPRTYSWLFKHAHAKPILLTPELLINSSSPYEIKQLIIKLNRKKEEPLLLVKPKNFSISH